MTKIFSGIAIFFLLLGYYMLVPKKTCAVGWQDINLKPIDGPFRVCSADIHRRRIGILEFAQVGSDVYRVSETNRREPAIGLRPQVFESILLIKLDVHINWDQLRSYYGGRYLSDGNVVLSMDGIKIPSLVPPLDVAKLRAVTGALREAAYVTDGHWVLNGYKVVAAADAATFQEVVALESDGTGVSYSATMEFARDRNHVYHGESILVDADPDSFGLISYNLSREPPPGISFHSDAVSLGSGWVAVDREKAWEVDFTGIVPLQLSANQLKRLQQDLKIATAASLNGFKRGPKFN